MQKKIAITIDNKLLSEIDYLVEQKIYPSRSKAIEANLEINRDSFRRRRFEMECAKLDPQEEKEFAEWGGFQSLSAKPPSHQFGEARFVQVSQN